MTLQLQRLLQMQVAVETDEDWRNVVLKQRALSVVEVWPEWAGPCQAMRMHLIRLKLTEGEDDLHLFSANASAISSLSRFREHSEPTWMILGDGEMVNVYIGCNRPRLLALVRRELRRERRVQRGEARRKALPSWADRPTAVERARDEAIKARETKQLQEEHDRRDAALRAVRMKQYHSLAESLPNYTVVLLLPHAQDDRLPQVIESLQATWSAMGIHVESSTRVSLSSEEADEVFWERRLPQHAALVDSMRSGPCLALLLRRAGQRAGRPVHVLFSRESSDEDEYEHAGGCGDAPKMAATTQGQYGSYYDDEDEEGEDEAVRMGLVERLVAETVYGFYPGSASTSARNDSMSEFFSPVGFTPPLQTSPLQSDSTASARASSAQLRSTTSWVQRSTTPSLLADPLGPFRPGTGPGEDDWADHDYEGLGQGSLSNATGSPHDQAWFKELRPVAESAAAALLQHARASDSDPDDVDLVLPGVWTPLTPLSKAAAVRVLFKDWALQFYDSEVPPQADPAATVVVFRAAKRYQVLETTANHLSDVLHMGFFTEDRKLLALTPAEYDALPYKELRDRLVMALRSSASEGTLLEMADYAPVYVSPTKAVAKADMAEFFTSGVERAGTRIGPPLQGDDDDNDNGLSGHFGALYASQTRTGQQPRPAVPRKRRPSLKPPPPFVRPEQSERTPPPPPGPSASAPTAFEPPPPTPYPQITGA